MPTAIASVEVALGALAVLIAAWLVITFVRRRTISRGRTLGLCGLRRAPSDRWRMGLTRLGSTQLDWFTLMGFSARPRYSWERSALELGAPGTLDRAERLDLVPDAVTVWCTVSGERYQLAMPPASYTALRSWSEAAPPGSTVNVA